MESIKELRKICQPSSEGATIVYRTFRAFSIYLTWFFLHFKKITANQITVGGTALFVLSAFCYAKGEYWLNFIGIFLLLFMNTLDYADGEVARYRGQVTQMSGNLLEPLTHDIKYAFIFLPLVLGEYFVFPCPSALIFLGFSASACLVLFRLTKLRYIHIILGSQQSEESYQKIGEKSFYSNKKVLMKLFAHIMGTSDILVWLLLATILDKVYLVIILYGTVMPAAYLVLLFKQYKGIKALKYE